MTRTMTYTKTMGTKYQELGLLSAQMVKDTSKPTKSINEMKIMHVVFFSRQ